ncbi:MAG: tetratricopeptide repeat protein [Planctomycetota bacterium]
MFNSRAYQKSLVLLSDLLDGESVYSDVGGLYVLCADLELRVNEDSSKALGLLKKAQQLGGLDLAHFYATRGLARWNAGDEQEAIEDLENSIALNPDAEVMSCLGRLLTSAYDKRAAGIWNQILEREPDNCSAHTFAGMEAARSGDRDLALRMAARAKKLTASADESFELARLYEHLEMGEEAISAYLEANRLGFPDKGELYARIATSYAATGDMDHAAKSVKKVVKVGLHDDYVKDAILWIAEQDGAGSYEDILPREHRDTCLSFVLRARAAAKRNDSAKARKLVWQAEQLDPSAAEMYHIGCVYQCLYDWGTALVAFTECRRRGYPGHFALYGCIAACHACLNHAQDATKFALKALDIDFTFDSAKAILLWAVEESESASAVESLLEEKSETCLALVLLAYKAILDSDYCQAAELIARAEQLNPSVAEMYGIGRVHHGRGNIEEALSVYAECETLDYEYKSQLYASIADCHCSLEHYDVAVKYAVRALTEYPAHEHATNVLLACRKAVWGSNFGDNY